MYEGHSRLRAAINETYTTIRGWRERDIRQSVDAYINGVLLIGTLVLYWAYSSDSSVNASSERDVPTAASTNQDKIPITHGYRVATPEDIFRPNQRLYLRTAVQLLDQAGEIDMLAVYREVVVVRITPAENGSNHYLIVPRNDVQNGDQTPITVTADELLVRY